MDSKTVDPDLERCARAAAKAACHDPEAWKNYVGVAASVIKEYTKVLDERAVKTEEKILSLRDQILVTLRHAPTSMTAGELSKAVGQALIARTLKGLKRGVDDGFLLRTVEKRVPRFSLSPGGRLRADLLINAGTTDWKVCKVKR